jgi:flagellar basal body-associated protein FliL
MAEKEKAEKKPERKPEAAAAPAEKPKGGGLAMLNKTPVLLGVAMVLEAVVLFAGFKFLGSGAKSASGASASSSETKVEGVDKGEGGKASSKDAKKTAEIKVLDFKAENKQSGRTFLYDLSVFVSVKGPDEEKVNSVIKGKEALIQDRVRTIIAESDPEKLGGSEPGLETLRRQIKFQLDEIVGDGVIDEVLVPRCIPYPAGY